MSIHIKTPIGAKPLYEKIVNSIKSNQIDTWILDDDGDFTHTPLQWRNQAWLKYYTNGNELIFGILSRRDIKMSKLTYGVYHGRFSEMLLTHFDNEITSIQLTSLPDNYDNI